MDITPRTLRYWKLVASLRQGKVETRDSVEVVTTGFPSLWGAVLPCTVATNQNPRIPPLPRFLPPPCLLLPPLSRWTFSWTMDFTRRSRVWPNRADIARETEEAWFPSVDLD
uniref:Uncharacterized protein n=1 Tax=Cacopsylla melanoneura TaxID=428564 RepID=A0A8D9AYL3_9HEMI